MTDHEVVVGGAKVVTPDVEASNGVIHAIDSVTGELMWSHSLREGKRAAVSPRQLSGRGVSYWTDGRGDERIIYVTTGYRLVELNAKTGQPSTGLYIQIVDYDDSVSQAHQCPDEMTSDKAAATCDECRRLHQLRTPRMRRSAATATRPTKKPECSRECSKEKAYVAPIPTSRTSPRNALR